mmetsp:Transcript_36488/g.75947  ORF Transcript_36488/g.75947 Transcript_36488/m.75947 type:complete len:208 (+) Transcript_36488:2570-3193(+)
MAKCNDEIPRSLTSRFWASSPDPARFVSDKRASNFCKSVPFVSRTSWISGRIAPNRCADVSKVGLVVTSILAMQCLASVTTFFIVFVSVGASFLSILIQHERTPCWIIIPLTDCSSAIRLKPSTICSRVCSLAPSTSCTIARGTLADAIFRTRSWQEAGVSGSSSASMTSFSSAVLPSFCISSYCSIVISFPSNPSFRICKFVAAIC